MVNGFFETKEKITGDVLQEALLMAYTKLLNITYIIPKP